MLVSIIMKIAFAFLTICLFLNPASTHVEPESSHEIVNTLSLTKNTNCLLNSSPILETSEDLRKKKISTLTLFKPFNFFNLFSLLDIKDYIQIKISLYTDIYFFNPLLFYSKLHLNSPPLDNL